MDASPPLTSFFWSIWLWNLTFFGSWTMRWRWFASGCWPTLDLIFGFLSLLVSFNFFLIKYLYGRAYFCDRGVKQPSPTEGAVIGSPSRALPIHMLSPIYQEMLLLDELKKHHQMKWPWETESNDTDARLRFDLSPPWHLHTLISILLLFLCTLCPRFNLKKFNLIKYLWKNINICDIEYMVLELG
jgi:hypothetical protein